MDSDWISTASRRGKGKDKTKYCQEEMKNQLKEAGLYEEGMSELDMEPLLRAVDDSKQLARQSMEKALSVSQPDLYEVPSSPITSYCPNDNHVSPSSPDQAAINEITATESTAFYSNKYTNKHSNEDDQITSRDNYEESSLYSHYRTPIPDGKGNIHQNSTNQDTMIYSSTLINRFEGWRINPLDCKKLDNDMPLKRPKKRPSVLRPKFQLVNGIPVIPDEIRDKQRLILDEVAGLWHRHTQKPNNDDVQWGTPIKEGKANGSLDKNPVKPRYNEKQDQVSELSDTLKSTRQMDLRSRNIEKKSCFNVSDDDEEKGIFQNKRKKISGNINLPLPRRNGDIKTKNNQKSEVDMGKDDKKDDNLSTLYDFIDDVNDYDKITPAESYKNRTKSATPECPEVSSKKKLLPTKQSNFYDFIVEVHDNPDIQNRTLIRSDSVEYEPLQMQTSPKVKKKHFLTEGEIEAQLITDDEEEEDKVIPPSPESRVSKRLKLGSILLQSSREKEENAVRRATEESRLTAEKEIQAKTQRIKQRTEESAAKIREHELEIKRRKDKEERYRNTFGRTRRSSRTELESNDLPKSEIVWDRNHKSSETARVSPVAHNNSENLIEHQPQQIQCPICGIDFPIDQVETHAGRCEAFTNDEENNSQPSTQYDLYKCVEEDKTNKRVTNTVGSKAPIATNKHSKKRKR